MKRGLLTERDREILLEEADDVDDLSKRKNEIRYEVRQRRDNLIRDFQVLQEAGEDEILESILVALSDVGLSEIRQQLNQIEAELDSLEEDYHNVVELRAQVDEIKQRIGVIEAKQI